MIDPKLVREGPEALQRILAKKAVPVDLGELVEAEARTRTLQTEVEALRSGQKRLGDAVRSAPDDATRAKAKAAAREASEGLKELEGALAEARGAYETMLALVPNPPHDSVPEGANEDANEVLRVVGDPPAFDFDIRDQETLGELLDILDIRRGARTSGSRFVYLKGGAALLEFALIRYALEKAMAHGFEPVIPPVLVREAAMYGTGFFPAEKFEIYKAEEEDLYLVGTSEVPLAALHMDEILEAGELPRRYVGFSTCFRREAGAYGRDTRGAFRVHQFDKLELFSFTHPEESWDEHERILAIEEEIVSGLGLAYRVVNVCGGELGAPAAKKYDIEVWLPSEGRYREATSCSNCTDYQARRLKARFRSEGGTSLVHTLNGTAVAAARWVVFVIENFQQADGSVLVPEPLRPWVGRDAIEPPARG